MTIYVCQITIIRPSVQNSVLNFLQMAWWWLFDRNYDNICVSNDHHQAICTKFRTEFSTDGLMMVIWQKLWQYMRVKWPSSGHLYKIQDWILYRWPDDSHLTETHCHIIFKCTFLCSKETVCISCGPKTQQMSSVQKLRGLLRKYYLICYKYVIATPDLIRGGTSWKLCASNCITTNCAADKVMI